MDRKFYGNKTSWFACKSLTSKLTDFKFTEAQFCARCHGNSIIDFHAIYGF